MGLRRKEGKKSVLGVVFIVFVMCVCVSSGIKASPVEITIHDADGKHAIHTDDDYHQQHHGDQTDAGLQQQQQQSVVSNGRVAVRPDGNRLELRLSTSGRQDE